jgi:hypothetical protein
VDPEDQIVAQMGLLLTQVRYSRIALEHIERATTAYAGIALSIPGGGGAAALGAPPLIDGALKVYVVNINDLTAGPGIGDMLAGVIGGAGRFLGGFFGGLAGGAVGSLAFPYLFVQMRQIVESIERIVNSLGLNVATDDAKKPPPSGGPSIMVQLRSLSEVLREVAAVFRAAAPAGPSVAAPPTTGPVHTYLELVRGVANVVDGLILLVPLLTGALASFLLRLRDIQFAIVDMLQFGLRNVLLLRAAVLAIVLDTLSLAGRLAAGVVEIVATAVETVLESVFRVIHAGLVGVLGVMRIVSTGVKSTVDALMIFLRDGVGSLLIFLGGLRVFQLAFHLAQVLPAVLPAIARIVDRPLSREETAALGTAASLLPTAPTSAATAPPIAAFPDVANTFLTPGAEADLVHRIDSMGQTIRDEAGTSSRAVQGAFEGMSVRMRDTVGTLDDGLDQTLTTRLATARGHAVQLADSLRVAEEASRRRPATGLETIASAYEGWLRGGGLQTLMGELDAHFRGTPAAAGAGSVAGQVVTGIVEGAGTRTVVVEIGEVTIDLGDGAPQAGPEASVPASTFDPEAYIEWQRNQETRLGIVPVPAATTAGNIW